MAWHGLRKAMRADARGVRTVLAVAPALGMPADELAWHIELESGWRTDARNPDTNASGLIQFLPSTLRTLGFQGTPADFRGLSHGAQARWVHDYFARFGRWRRTGDVRLMGFGRQPSTPDATILFPVGSEAWRLNPSVREGADGPITARSVRESGELPRDEPMPALAVPPDRPERPPAGRQMGDLLGRIPWPVWAAIALLLTRRRGR